MYKRLSIRGETDGLQKESEGSGPMYVCDVNQREIVPNKEVEKDKKKKRKPFRPSSAS